MTKCLNLVLVAASLIFTSPLHAQQQEAALQKVKVPGTGFDLVLAKVKAGGASSDFRGMPDPLIVYSGDGNLAFAVDAKTQELLKDVGILKAPACTFQAESDNLLNTVTVYVVPNREVPTAVRVASLNAPQPGPTMRKQEVSGSDLDIVYAMTKTPIILGADEPTDSLAVYSTGSEFTMATNGDLERMFRDVGYSQLPACAFEVEHKGSNPSQAASVYIFPKN